MKMQKNPPKKAFKNGELAAAADLDQPTANICRS